MGFDYRNMMNVTCSHITFVGKGKTTILGGVFVHGKQNVKFEELSVTNPKKMDKKKQKKTDGIHEFGFQVFHRLHIWIRMANLSVNPTIV